MRNFFKHSVRIILLSVIMTVLWMFSLGISHSFFPGEIRSSGASPEFSMLMLFTVCLINSLVIYIMIRNSKWNFLRTTVTVFVVLFGIQFFLSFIEAYVFNNALQMPMGLLLTTFVGGCIMALLYAPLSVWISGKNKEKTPRFEQVPVDPSAIRILKIIILACLVYPLLYSLAGYYIAWQFEAVRIFYTGSSVKEPFLTMTLNNLKSGLLFLAMSRGLIWVMIGLLVYYMVDMTNIQKALLIGALFALIMNSQHIIPNPYMPRMVSFAHFIETASSNFIWGYAVAWLWAKPLSRSHKIEIAAETA